MNQLLVKTPDLRASMTRFIAPPTPFGPAQVFDARGQRPRQPQVLGLQSSVMSRNGHQVDRRTRQRLGAAGASMAGSRTRTAAP